MGNEVLLPLPLPAKVGLLVAMVRRTSSESEPDWGAGELDTAAVNGDLGRATDLLGRGVNPNVLDRLGERPCVLYTCAPRCRAPHPPDIIVFSISQQHCSGMLRSRSCCWSKAPTQPWLTVGWMHRTHERPLRRPSGNRWDSAQSLMSNMAPNPTMLRRSMA